MEPLRIDKLIMDDTCKNESDAYQVAFYRIGSFKTEKIICDNIEKNNCNKFRIIDINWLKEQSILSLPDAIIMNSNIKLTNQENQILNDVNIQPVWIDENSLSSPTVFKEKIKEIERTVYKSKCFKYLEIEKNVVKSLEDKYTHIPADNEKLTNKLIEELVKLIKDKDDITYTHIKNVSDYVDIYVSGMPENKKLSENQIKFLKNAALVHDIGKLIIPNQILKKSSGLDNNEFHNIKRHVSENSYLFNCKLMEDYKDIALCHHERYDGSGYPKGLAAGEIPYFARVISVLDAFEVMTGNRSYVRENQKSLFESLKSLQDGKGTQFDPEIVDCFINGVIKNPDFQRKINSQISGGNENEIRKCI